MNVDELSQRIHIPAHVQKLIVPEMLILRDVIAVHRQKKLFD